MIQYKGLKSLETLENAKNYNQWIIDQFKKQLKGPLLEIGSGTGNISSYLPQNTQVFLSDNDMGLVSFLKKKFKNCATITTTFYDVTKFPSKEYLAFFSTVVAINVLEHIEDDRAALKNISALLKKNGKVCMLVPANQFAYTHLDKNLGHFRRYEKKELKDKFEKSGFIIEKLYPFNMLGLIGWFMLHKVSKRAKSLNASQVALFERLVPALRLFEMILPIPKGISFIVIARKK